MILYLKKTKLIPQDKYLSVSTKIKNVSQNYNAEIMWFTASKLILYVIKAIWRKGIRVLKLTEG